MWLAASEALRTARQPKRCSGGFGHSVGGAAAPPYPWNRRDLRYAAETVWPSGVKANAAIRTEFKIPPNKGLK